MSVWNIFDCLLKTNVFPIACLKPMFGNHPIVSLYRRHEDSNNVGSYIGSMRLVATWTFRAK